MSSNLDNSFSAESMWMKEVERNNALMDKNCDLLELVAEALQGPAAAHLDSEWIDRALKLLIPDQKPFNPAGEYKHSES